MIELKNLHKKFGKLKVLNNLSAQFLPSQVTAVIGHNGSGKTTMIKCVLGMVNPDAGEIFIENKKVNGGWQYRKNIGYMPQIGRYPDNMTIGQVFKMIRDIRAKESAQIDEELIAQFGLNAMGNKKLGILSGGTRQKVSAALAFLFSPQILILDEPTAGLDPLAAEILKDKIQQEKNKGKLIIITSHIMSEIEEMADELLFIFEGKVAFNRSIAALKKESGNDRIGKALKEIIQHTATQV
jgi:Cu-processing system ATP-binding protein